MSQVGGFAELIVIFFLPGLVVGVAVTPDGTRVVAFMVGAVVAGKVVNDNLINNTKNNIKKYFYEKGFLNATVSIKEFPDSILSNSVLLKIIIDKNQRVKINQINITGNVSLSLKKVKKALKETKEKSSWNILSSSKFQEKTFEEDKALLVEKYNELGYRDASITFDTVYKFDDKSINIDLTIHEGPKYYFGDINFIGNIEGRDLFNDKADVIVCDGFTGNIVLKLSETFHDMTAGKGMDAPFFARLNYENYGGSPVLGVNAPVVVGHGISNDIAIKNLILLAKEMVSTNLTEKIKAAFKE